MTVPRKSTLFSLSRHALCLVLLTSALPAGAQEAAAPRVVIAAAYSEEVNLETRFVGRGEASAKTDMVAQVTGAITQINVEDGASVFEGQVIYHIDPASYRAAVAAQRAAVTRSEANLKLAYIERDRKEELFRRNTIAESEVDIAEANAAVAEADFAAAVAALQNAELDLERSEVRAPFAGRIGKANISLGTVVGPTSGPLATLVRQSPMYVTFSLSEPQLLGVLERLDLGMDELVANNASPDVHVTLPSGTTLEEPGEIVFLDNRINPATGTISVRAEFENARQMILDGSFVTVLIEDLEPTIAVLIPQNAVQRDQRGDFVLVINDQQLVEQRYVELGAQVETAVIVAEGLRSGESVIVEGLQKVRPGVAVDAVLAGSGEGN